MTSTLDIGGPPHPTDRERAIALELNRTFRATDGSTPALVTSFAHALAAYRVELERRGARESAYALVECELRDRRVVGVRMGNGGMASAGSVRLDMGDTPCGLHESLIAAVDALGGST